MGSGGFWEGVWEGSGGGSGERSGGAIRVSATSLSPDFALILLNLALILLI